LAYDDSGRWANQRTKISSADAGENAVTDSAPGKEKIKNADSQESAFVET
jgi:hypothetical protein